MEEIYHNFIRVIGYKNFIVCNIFIYVGQVTNLSKSKYTHVYLTKILPVSENECGSMHVSLFFLKHFISTLKITWANL